MRPGAHKHVPAAQIAVIVDPESALYLDEANPRIDAFNSGLAHALHHTGAPHRAFSWGDLPDLDLSPYRLVILPYLFVMNEERRRRLDATVCRDGRTVLWLYRPGVSTAVTMRRRATADGGSQNQPGIRSLAG